MILLSQLYIDHPLQYKPIQTQTNSMITTNEINTQMIYILTTN